jgi:hypothetical protein
MEATSIYQELLGADFERLGPILRYVHGPAASVHAHGSVDVTHGKGLAVRLLNRMMAVPKAGTGIALRLEVVRSAKREAWIRTFDKKVLRTEQWAEDGLFIEAVGAIQMAMRLRIDAGKLCFEPVFTRCLGIRVPRWVRVTVRAEVEELADGWRVLVETSSSMLGLLFRYNGIIALQP